MDSSIRVLLQSCLDENDPNSVSEPYQKLKTESDGNAKSNVGTDLYVICAEAACQYQKFDVAEDCIKMYFKNSPPENQYLCRAYMCQAQLYAPTSTKNPAQIDKAVHYLLKAINFAKQNQRYHFLVYNASVLYWQFCRPFLKPNYKRFLAKTLHQVVKALDDIDDEDYEWRAQLMIALIECHIDAGRKDDANQIASTASQFTKNNVPNLYKNILGLQIKYKLIEYGKLAKETKSSPDLHLFFKIHRLKVQLETEEKSDVGHDLTKFFKNLTGMCETDISGTSTELSERSSAVNIPRTATPVAMETIDRLTLILELAKLCMAQDFCKLANDCLDYIKKYTEDPATNLAVEFIRCELMVKLLGDKQETYSQSVVQLRLEAIEKLEQYLTTALRYGDPEVIQLGCMTMWNLCLPLLQSNLRRHVRKPLSLVADALESIDSLLALLRCEIHTELAKCEEDEEQLELALMHLRKALLLDDDGVYSERLETSLTRIQLRSTLYTTPERPEDVAAMIIEQARTSKDSGTSKMKRASLIKAGIALAPDAFAMVLESESETKEPSKDKNPPTLFSKLARRAEHFEKAVSKAAGHLKRLGTQNDQERVRIWADLTKTARKQQIWDVVRVAARFCLLYDDGRWSMRREKQTGDDEGGYVEEEKTTEGRSSSGAGSRKADGQMRRMSMVPEETKSDVEKDLLRILAEIYFINAEALVQFLKNQGVQLCDKPTPPAAEDTTTHSRKHVAAEDSSKWTVYREWISSLSQAAIYGFQHAAELGSELEEVWLVCNSAVYLLNYTTHHLAQHRHRELVPILAPVLKHMKIVGHAFESTLLCQVCNILATGLLQPWYPTPSKMSIAISPLKKDGKKDKSAGKPAPKITTSGFEPDALAEMKQALEHLEYALQVTNGNDSRNLVPISVRHSVIKTWVHCKQLLAQQIPKNYGHDSENPNSQGPMSRSLCAVEMISVHLQGLSDFPSAPTLQEVVRMVGNCVWSDDAVALEMWSRLAVLSFNADNHQLVMECGKKAMALAEDNKSKNREKGKNITSAIDHVKRVKQQLLYYASVIMGQSLIKNMKGQTKMRRDALIHFVNACRFGEQAKNYDLVITAARRYWNAVLPLVGEPIERQLLREPLEAILRCVAVVAEKNIGKDDEDEDEEECGAEAKTGKSIKTKEKTPKDKKDKTDQRKKSGKTKDDPKSDKTSKMVEKSDEKKGAVDQSTVEGGMVVNVYDEDLKMRAAMYGVLFQAYADQGEWEQGLRAMDQAVKDMPRTSHRLLIFKHRVITKSKLGRDVQFDMGKFKNENELVISSMWHYVALNSNNSREQLMAYQNAIDVLQSPQSDWQKADYLLEFGEWLFVNEFPVDDAMDQFLWATDILMNKSDVEQRPDSDNVVCDEHDYTTKTRSISSAVSHSNAHVTTITDIRTLEYLARVHIMLAQLVGRKSSKFIDYCLFAVTCVQRIWKVCLEFAEKVSRDGAKAGDVTPTKKGNKEKAKDQKDAKVDKSTSKTYCPSSSQAWATFEIPEKFVEYFKCDDSGRLISTASFLRPALSVHYFNVLMDDLCSLGYHLLSLPIASLLRCLAKYVIENELLLKLVRLRMMEICQDLRLIEEALCHENAAKESENDKNEIAKSREEIELWKEKQRQVKREETRLVNSDTKTTITTQSKGHLDDLKQSPAEQAASNNWMKHRRKITKIERREIWIKQAEIFIKQGHYQAARELLNEAKTSALVFEDDRTHAEVLHNLALLAYHEANWQQAISLLQELQSFNGDHAFWLKTVVLLVDAMCGKTDRSDVHGTTLDNKAKKRAIMLLQRSMATFKRLSEDNPNKACRTDYVMATLEEKLGSVMARNTLTQTKNEETCSLTKACEHLQSSEVSLLQSGYKREAVKVKCERAMLMRRLVGCASSSGEKRQYYLQALAVLKTATELSNNLLHQVQAVSSLEELCNLSLPTEREAVETRLCFGELGVEIMNEHAKDERARRNREARKGSVEKLIDDFVQVEPKMSEKEKKWNLVTRTIAEDTLLNLSVSFSHCGAVPYLKTKCYLVLGHCLRTVASYLNPDDDPQWHVEQNVSGETTANQASNKPTSDDEINDCEELSSGELVEGTSNDFESAVKKTMTAEFLKSEYKDCLRTLTQAVECLTQCVQLGMKHGYTELVADASYHLVEILGRHDMSSASLYLALFQSCSMAVTLHSLLQRCQVDSSSSRLAALIRQRNQLTKTLLHQEALSSVLASNTQALAEFEAWRRLSICKNHLEIIKELSSPSTLYLVLQHSKDRSFLYATTLDKPRSALSSAKPAKQSAGNTSGSVTKAIISRSKVDPEELDNLLEKFEKFKLDEACELIRQNYLRRQAEEKRKMLATVDNAYSDRKTDVLLNNSTIKEKEENLERQYVSIIKEMEAYISPVLEQLKPTLSANVIPETIIILADEQLLRLPLESLSLFTSPNVQCLARDFSLQIHSHRFHTCEASVIDAQKTSQRGTESRADGKNKGAAGKKCVKGDVSATAKSQDKKGEKKVSKDQGIPKEGIALDMNGLRYIVDPFNECSNKEDDSPEKVMNELVAKYRQLSAKWSGLIGNDHVASIGEWQKLMKESSLFIFYGTQKCLNYVPPSQLVPLSLPDCNMMLILDHVETSESFLRQAAVDATKNSSELALELPFESAALLSLTGVNCIIANQWNCKLQENKERLNKIMEVAIDESKSIGCALRKFTEMNPKDSGLKQEEQILNPEKPGLDCISTNEATVDQDKAQKNNLVMSKNTVLYGIPYFMLNPQKV